MTDRIDALFDKPYWIVDVLPEQVPRDAPGQYPAAESYYLTEPQYSLLRGKYAQILIRLNCYFDLRLASGDGEKWELNPAPRTLARAFAESGMTDRVLVLAEPGPSLLVWNGDDTWMTVYDPTPALLRLLRPLAASEGLFLWRPDQKPELDQEPGQDA